MPSGFFRYGIREAQEDTNAIGNATGIVRTKYYEGDHWQEGEGWIGPAPEKSDADAVKVWSAIEKGFQSKNVVKEVVDRHKTGVVGREPNWYLTPIETPVASDEGQVDADKKASKKLIEEAEAVLTAWWDKRGLLNILQDAVRHFLTTGRGSLRLYIPSGLLTEGAVPNTEVGKALRRYVWIEAPPLGRAAIVESVETKERLALYSWEDKGRKYYEVSFLEEPFDEEASRTVIRTIGPEGEGDQSILSESIQSLGGQLLVFELSGEALINDQVIQAQRLINLARSLMKENVIYGGFLERVITNAEIPGEWKTEGGKRKFVPAKWEIGAGVTSFVNSRTIKDEDGNVTALPASVQYREPIPVDTFRDTRDVGYEDILDETKQTFVLMNRDGNASGASRKQARYDFLMSLLKTKPVVDEAIRWLLTTALELEATLSGKPGYFRSLRVMSDLKVDAGPLTDEERAEIASDYAAGLISRQSAMMLLGVDDVDAEVKKIDDERKTAPKPLNELVAAGYEIGPEQFPDIDRAHGFKVRDGEKLVAEKAEREALDREVQQARIRATSPAADADEDEV